MLKKTFLIFALFIIALAPVFVVKAQTAKVAKVSAVTKTPRTVVDFFMLLPNKYVNNYSAAARQKQLKNGTTDAANGYLEVFGQSDAEKNIYIAIFKKDAGGYLVTVAAGNYASAKVSDYYFLEYNNQKWTDVSKQVLPADFKVADFYDKEANNIYPCELPRYNRTINCRDKDSKLTYLGWTGSEFVIE